MCAVYVLSRVAFCQLFIKRILYCIVLYCIGGVVVAVGIDVVVDGPVVPLVPTVELPKVIVSYCTS